MQNSSVSWTAKWIASTIRGGPRTAAPAPYFRKAFRLDGPVKSSVLHITALGLYECEMNGKVVGDHIFAPGWTDYNKRVYFQSYDVTSLLSKGENAIGVILGDGWYSGHLAQHDRGLYGERPQLLAQLEITAKDGSVMRVVSDSSWKTTTGPILESDLIMGETYDARRELGAWSSGKYDDSAWLPIEMADDPKISIERSAGPPVHRKETFTVKDADAMKIPGRPDCRIYDFGQNLTGRVRLTVKGVAGTRIILRHAEVLDKDGSIYIENLRTARATDSYTLKGEGTEVWEPRFTFHGFRYAEIRRAGPEEGFALEKAEAIVLHSDTPRTGTFKCSHKLLNQLEHNILWGQKGNFLEVPTDCPQRDERLGWTGDAQVFVRTAAMNADVAAFFTKWLVDVDDGQTADGAFSDVNPNTMGCGSVPAWADAGVICPWTIYEAYGDCRVLQQHYASMQRYIDFCQRRSTPEMLPPEKFHCFGDWLSIKANTPKEVICTAYFAYSTRLTARAAEALGKTEDATRYRELFEKIKASFNRAYVAEDGRIKGDTQCCYVLALAFDLLDEKKQELAAKYLIEDIEKCDWHLSTGFIGTKDLMLVLSKIGRNDVAYRLLHNDTFPSWGFSIKHGATSIWERWDGWTPEKGFQDPGMNSFAHYSFGAVYQWIVENVGGIRTDGPAYKRIVIAPQPGGRLTWAKVGYRSIRGPIDSDWKLDAGRLLMDVTIPPGATATVRVPAAKAADVTEGGQTLNAVEGLKFLRMDSGRAVLAVESGTYHFVSSSP